MWSTVRCRSSAGHGLRNVFAFTLNRPHCPPQFLLTVGVFFTGHHDDAGEFVFFLPGPGHDFMLKTNKQVPENHPTATMWPDGPFGASAAVLVYHI